MAVNAGVIGKTYPATTYAVGREKVREYALAVGETNALYLDVDAARAAGYDDVVAPPMFAVVYSMPAVAQALFDPDVGIDFAHMVHGGQDFEWGPLVVAGDEITTTATWAIEYRPCRMRPGRPTCRANSSSTWIGLKSPEAPA